MSDTTHQERILDQFTRQATPFSTANTITDVNALRMIVTAAAPTPDDTVLDVACGGGIVVCAFAPHVRHATGIDMTPAMLDRARQLATEKTINNVTWDRGDVAALPYADGAFDVVVTRFSMHHFLDPLSVLREMVRVCAPGGRVVVMDMYASDDPAKAVEWNRAEKLRDPSHVRCLTLPELKALFGAVGLSEPTRLSTNCATKSAICWPAHSRTRAMKPRSSRCSPRRPRMTGWAFPCGATGERIDYAYPIAILVADEAGVIIRDRPAAHAHRPATRALGHPARSARSPARSHDGRYPAPSARSARPAVSSRPAR